MFGKIGRAETATDPAPLAMVETVITLEAARPSGATGMTWERLVAGDGRRSSAIPGMPNLCWMPIQTRTEMLATGVRSALGIKVFGPDLADDRARRASRSSACSPTCPARAARSPSGSRGGFYLDFAIDREAAARYGLRVRDVNEVVETAIGGATSSQTVEGRERYPINVRYARDFRDDPDALGRVLVRDAGGRAGAARAGRRRSSSRSGRDFVRSEAGQLVGFVSVDVAERPIVDYVHDARRAVARAGDAARRARGSSGPASSSTSSAPSSGCCWSSRSRSCSSRCCCTLNTGSLVETGDRAARGAVLADRRGLAALAARLQPERRGVGRPDRARRARRADRRRDAALPHARAPRARSARGRCATRATSRTRSSRAPRAGSGRSS